MIHRKLECDAARLWHVLGRVLMHLPVCKRVCELLLSGLITVVCAAELANDTPTVGYGFWESIAIFALLHVRVRVCILFNEHTHAYIFRAET